MLETVVSSLPITSGVWLDFLTLLVAVAKFFGGNYGKNVSDHRGRYFLTSKKHAELIICHDASRSVDCRAHCQSPRRII